LAYLFKGNDKTNYFTFKECITFNKTIIEKPAGKTDTSPKDAEVRAIAAEAPSALIGSDTPYSPHSNAPHVSPRQREVLFWAAHGKSAWETGRILNLTEATVKSYIASACKRLNAQNKVHAVAICITLGVFRI
jgi:DNA-binding CsgD family transcriptional regulator